MLSCHGKPFHTCQYRQFLRSSKRGWASRLELSPHQRAGRLVPLPWETLRHYPGNAELLWAEGDQLCGDPSKIQALFPAVTEESPCLGP